MGVNFSIKQRTDKDKVQTKFLTGSFITELLQGFSFDLQYTVCVIDIFENVFRYLLVKSM